MNDILLVEAAQAKGWIRCPRCNIWVERAYGYFSTITCSWICRTIFHNADFMILDTDAGLGFATNVGGRLDLGANAWTAIASCFRCFSC
ncbi:hypothetical protein CFP56_008852 [Quercus suber]|uniref:Uncharacterized protein n=1 Tax=Quercus suber TaxID=58331 RepID=A0AAW0L5G1_QUESU